MSTRRKDVRRAMKPDRLVEMKPLSEEEGWELFRRRAFRNKHVGIYAEEIRDNERIEEVPESFLRNLPSLKVLDLCRMSIKSLPTSLRHLCKDLVHLDLSATKIKKFSESIGDLIRLKFLRLVDCKKLRHLPLSIAQLTSLCLHTDGSGIYVGNPGKFEIHSN